MDGNNANDEDELNELNKRCEKIIENDPGITSIDYFYEVVTDETLQRICNSLQNNTVVGWILMEGCSVTSIGCSSLGEMLGKNNYLRHIVLNSNRDMGLEGIRALMEGLAKNDKLESIMLEDVDFRGAEGSLKAVANALERNRSLKEISMGRNDLGGVEFQEFARSLKNNTSLLSIELGHCQLTNADVEVLFQSIENHPTLVRVDLTSNLLTSEISESLARLLRQNNILQDINLTTNTLGKTGAEKMAVALETNETLKKLMMGKNEIGEDGAKAFGRSLPKIRGLRELFLASNNLSVEALEVITEGMKDNTSLHSIRLGNGDGGTPIPPEIMKNVKFYERRNKLGWATLNQSRTALPSGLWAEILGKVGSEEDPSMLHFFLREAPGNILQGC